MMHMCQQASTRQLHSCCARSAASDTHCKGTVTVTSAGAVKKPSVPYHPNAARSRLNNHQKRLPPPFSSTLSLGKAKVKAVSHDPMPYMTTAKFAQRHVKKPMHTRVGYTNDGIVSDLTRRAKKGYMD